MKFENIPKWPEWQQASSSAFQIRAKKPKLVRIDNLIKKYHQVLDMSKLNILMELKKAIEDWTADKIDRNVGTGRLDAMQALQEVVLRKLYELDGWGKHRYLKAVCMGYQVSSGPYSNRKPADNEARRKEETVEIGARVQTLCAAIREAYAKYQSYAVTKAIPADEDHKTLKIFMAPEFFFRGPFGAYRDIGWLARIFSMMRTETSKPQYADWLFVHGTALFSTEKMESDVSTGILLQNFALVQKGGPKTAEHQDFYVEKEFPSHVDFKHPGVSDLGWYDPSKSKAKIAGDIRKAISPEGGRIDTLDPLDASSGAVSELVGGTIFTMDGITFGLEVCRDHYLRRLAHSKEAGKVLIQLIPSCGMEIEQNAVACVPEGIVFNVDGATPHVMIGVNSSTAPLPNKVPPDVATGGGTIILFDAMRIPWPGLARADVAARLKVPRNVLSGTAPVPPPRP